MKLPFHLQRHSKKVNIKALWYKFPKSQPLVKEKVLQEQVLAEMFGEIVTTAAEPATEAPTTTVFDGLLSELALQFEKNFIFRVQQKSLT